MRLGTLRFRLPWFHGQQILPDHRTRMIYRVLRQQPDGSMLYGTILWRDCETWKAIDRWDVPHGWEVKAVSPDGKRVLLTELTSAFTVQLWDASTRRLLQSFRIETGAASTEGGLFSFPPDGKTIVTREWHYLNPSVMRVWDVASGKELWHNGAIWPIGFIDDGRTLVGLHRKDNSISLRDLRTGREQRSFAAMPFDAQRQCHLSPDGRTIMMGTDGPAVRSWNLASGKENPPLGGHQGRAYAFAFADDSKSVVTGGSDSFVQVWDWSSGRLRRRIDLGSGSVGTIRFMPEGKRLEVGMWLERALRYYDVQTGRELPAAADGHRGPIRGLAFLPSGEVISTGSDNTVRIWDPVSGRIVRQFSTHSRFFAREMSRSGDGKTLAVNDLKGANLQLLDVSTGRQLRTMKTPYEDCYLLAFAPAGNLLATASNTQSEGSLALVQLWDLATGRELRRIGGECCAGLTFSPDGRFLAINHLSRVGIWRVASGKLHRTFNVINPRHLSFAPDGRMLAVGSVYFGITLWEVATTHERLRLRSPDLKGDPWPDALCFSPDGRYLASTDGNARTIYLWDARTGELVHRFAGHENGRPNELVFSPDSRLLASGSDDTTILLWDVAAVTAKRRMLAAKLSDKEIQTCWDALTSKDAPVAYRAIGRLTASPRETVAFLKQHLRRAEPVEEKTLNHLILDLDSPVFATRERATEELSKLDRLAEPALRKALADRPSLEMRRRVQQILEQLAAVPTGNILRQLRAVEVLENIGTSEARQMLQTLAAGAAAARVTEEAKAALSHLAARPAVR